MKRIIAILCVAVLVLFPSCGVKESDYELFKMKTLEVHNVIEYGTPNTNYINEVIDNGIGHCGNYAFLLQYLLRCEGYNAKIYDIKSVYCGAVHSVVEVSDKSGKLYVCDPTNGCIFGFSLYELIDNPECASEVDLLCDKENHFIAYYCPDFYKGVYSFFCYNTLVQYEGFFYNYMLSDVTANIDYVIINSKNISIDGIKDNDVSSFEVEFIETDNEVTIEIGMIPTQFSVFAINFLSKIDGKYHIKNVKAYVHEYGKSDAVLTEINLNSNAGSFFELYGDSSRLVDKIYVTGEKIDGNQKSICITDMVVFEPINLCAKNN